MPEIASLYDWLRPTRKARIELDGQHVECRVFDELTGVYGYGTGVDLETAATAAVVDWQRNSAAEGKASAGSELCRYEWALHSTPHHESDPQAERGHIDAETPTEARAALHSSFAGRRAWITIWHPDGDCVSHSRIADDGRTA